jgi:predicted negative regulator of RcsB-dependent stress response
MESEVVQLPLSDQLWMWFQKNKKPVTWGTAIVVVAGLVVWFFTYEREQKQTQASEALSNVAVANAATTAGARPAGDADAYLKVAANFPGSSAAARAVLLAAGTLFGEGQYDKAQEQFQRFIREYHDSPFMSQALLGVAACLDAQNKPNDAVAAYKELIDRHPNDPVVPQAKFALGRIYEAQNLPEQAFNYYEQVAQADPYGSIGSEAGMRAEDLKLKHPNLAPAPAATSSSAPFTIQKPPAPAMTNAGAPPAPGKK